MFYYACLLLTYSANNPFKKERGGCYPPLLLNMGPHEQKKTQTYIYIYISIYIYIYCMRSVYNFPVLVQTKPLTFTNYE